MLSSALTFVVRRGVSGYELIARTQVPVSPTRYRMVDEPLCDLGGRNSEEAFREAAARLRSLLQKNGQPRIVKGDE